MNPKTGLLLVELFNKKQCIYKNTENGAVRTFHLPKDTREPI